MKGALTKTTVEEASSFHTALTVADIASFYTDHANHGGQNLCLEEGASRATNGNNCTTRADVLRSLLEWLLQNSQKDDCVRPEAFGGCSLDLKSEVPGRYNVHICLKLLATMSTEIVTFLLDCLRLPTAEKS